MNTNSKLCVIPNRKNIEHRLQLLSNWIIWKKGKMQRNESIRKNVGAVVKTGFNKLETLIMAINRDD